MTQRKLEERLSDLIKQIKDVWDQSPTLDLDDIKNKLAILYVEIMDIEDVLRDLQKRKVIFLTIALVVSIIINFITAIT